MNEISHACRRELIDLWQAHFAAGGSSRVHAVFEACVALLYWAGGKLGMSYEAINVWFFVVVWPLVTLALAATVLWQWRRTRQLRQRLEVAAPGRVAPEAARS